MVCVCGLEKSAAPEAQAIHALGLSHWSKKPCMKLGTSPFSTTNSGRDEAIL
ncbi:Unknown protein sequence [Pseudomonas amygdali pv. sesami]|nr:Unknown protein sequence [Pseudomonas amygdali pv. sesami]